MSSEYEVDAILDKRNVKSRVQYLIRWRNFPEDAATWESRQSLIKDGLKPLIDSYERAMKAQRGSARKTPSGKRLSRTPLRGSSARRRRDRTPLSDVEDEGPTGRNDADEDDGEAAPEEGKSESESEEEAEQAGKEAEAEAAEGAEAAGDEQAAIPSFHDVSEAVSESLTAVILCGVLVIGALLHGMVNVLVHESYQSDTDAINQVLDFARIATALLPSFAALYTVLSVRGHSEPYAKWIAIGLVWYVAAAVAQVATVDPECQEVVDQLSLAIVAVALFSFAIGLTQTDGKEAPSWSLGSAAIPVAGLAAEAYLLQETVAGLPQDKLIVLVVFSLLFANLLWRAVARLGLGARSWTSELSVPQWFGLLGAVAITLVDGFHILRRLDLVHDSEVKQAPRPETPREGMVLDFELYLYWIQTVGMAGFALSAIMSRKRSFV